MNLRNPRLAAICIAALSAVCSMALGALRAGAQQYHNIVNQRFHTISDGPQSAIIVDVADATDAAAVHKAVTQKMAAVNAARLPALQREIALLRKYHRLKPNQKFPIVDTVMLRQNGRLVLPAKKELTRGPGPNSLNYVVNTTPGTSYFFDLTNAATAQSVGNLVTLINDLNTELTNNVLGMPLWSGTVNVLNKDDNPDLNSGILGVTVVINGDTVNIDLPGAFLNTPVDQDEFLGMAQAMAQAFHGPLAIGYDAWEKGMARAAAVIAAQDLFNKYGVDPSNSFYYTPYYDLENQPALGNNTFLPPTASGQALSGLGGMIAPRLSTSGSAWLKCYIENSGFFKAFNSAYATAYAADPTIALDTTRLSALAAGVLPNVEAQPFAQWFQQQYVFDTSVTTGPKLYVNVIPTPPNTASTDDGVALALIYYQTTSTGDETDLNGTANPVYLDYTYTARLTLPGGDAQVAINNGQGDTGPLFDGIGNPQRITIDIPVDNSYQRIVYPALESTTGSGASLVYNDFFGVVVGSNAGSLTAQFNGGDGKPVTILGITEGAFGATGGSHIPAAGFTKVMLSYQPASGGQPIAFQRNIYEREESANLAGVANIFVLTAPTVTNTILHDFLNGPQLISLPIQPLNPDMAAVFGTTPSATLLAQYRQNAPGDQYLRYPTLPLYQPGYGLWTDFASVLQGPNLAGVPIVGVRTDNQSLIEVSLQYGWNLIGNPFPTALSILSDGTSGTLGGMTVQYLNGDALTWGDAVSSGWVAAGISGYDGGLISSQVQPTYTYQDITGTGALAPEFTQNMLEPWQGYWVLVTETEGVTLSYINPNPNTRAALPASRATVKRAAKPVAPSDPGAWRLPLLFQDDSGRTTSVTFGQSARGADSYVSALDVATPPAFTKAASLGMRFSNPTWNANTGTTEFLTDIRKTNSKSTWNVTVDLPVGQKSYALAWNGTAKLPRGTSLTLTDMTTRTQQLMNTTTRYTFTPNQGETTRSFQITVEPNALSQIAITNLRVDIPRLAGRAVASATISYEMTGVSEASVQILGFNGRVVRHLVVGRSTTAGVNQATWDLRDDQGRTLSTGTYVVEVQAHTPDGRQTRSIVTYQLIR